MAGLRLCAGVLFVTTALLVAGAGGQTGDCSAAYTTLTPCLSYVTGSDPTPSLLCCTALSTLDASNRTCLCQVVTQLSNGTAVPGVNVTKAHALPSACGISLDTATCPSLALPPAASIVPTPPGISLPPPPPGTPTGTSAPGSPASVTRPSQWVLVLAPLAVLGVSVLFPEVRVGVINGFN